MIKYSILSIKFNKKKQHPFIFKTLKMSQGGAPKIEEDIKKSDGELKKIELSGNKMILISNDKKSFEIPVEFAEYCGLLKTMISRHPCIFRSPCIFRHPGIFSTSRYFGI